MNRSLKTLVAYAEIALIAVLLAFNYQLFIVVNDFAPAGINGIATMVQYKTGFSIGYMSLIINIPLCAFAFFFVNRQFALRSLCFCLVYSFVYLGLQKIGFEAFQYDAQGHDTIFPVILSGVISGAVYGFCFRLNASTGGTDIVSKYISKHYPALNFFWVTFTLNAIVAVVSFFVYAKGGAGTALIYDYKPVCLCIMYCFISSFVGSAILKGTRSATKFTIITSHPQEITKDILRTLRHSATQLEAIGSYSGNERTVILCVINNQQIVELEKILARYDSTFSFSESVNDTYGNFKKIK